MAATNAVYVDGESRLPQARPTSAVSPAYVDGESGALPIRAYAGAAPGGWKPYWRVRPGARIYTPGVM